MIQMIQQDLLQKTADYIKQGFSDDSSGHDWWHIYRVWKNAITIWEHEQADSFIVQLAALPTICAHNLDLPTQSLSRLWDNSSTFIFYDAQLNSLNSFWIWRVKFYANL